MGCSIIMPSNEHYSMDFSSPIPLHKGQCLWLCFCKVSFPVSQLMTAHGASLSCCVAAFSSTEMGSSGTGGIWDLLNTTQHVLARPGDSSQGVGFMSQTPHRAATGVGNIMALMSSVCTEATGRTSLRRNCL